MWYRVVAISHARGLRTDEERRIARFLTYQRIGRLSGRIIGRRGYEDVDGGMALAERYSAVHGLAADAFWVDLRRLRRAGLVERVVSPAPGRRAVYALVLRADAIPHDLPEDLARLLGVWQLPAAEDDPAAEDALYGHLTAAVPAPLDEPAAVEVDEHTAAELHAAPRWEHPARSPAALAAAAIAEASRRVPKDERPDLRCTAVAAPVPIDDFAGWLALSKPETSPYYREGSQPSGLVSSAGSRRSGPPETMEEPHTAPSATAKRSWAVPSGDPLSVVADRVLRRAWAAWRRQLGRGRVILPTGAGSVTDGRHSGSAWSDLQRVIGIALRRSTESELVELITHNISEGVEDVGRLVAWRLWRLINTRRDAHGYGKRRQVAEAGHVVAWDAMTQAERERWWAAAAAGQEPGTPNPLAEQLRRQARERTARRRAEAEAARVARLRRWGIDPGPWREPEHVMRAVADAVNPPPPPRTGEESRAAALARNRQEGRRRRPGQVRDEAAAADRLARMQARARQHGARLDQPE